MTLPNVISLTRIPMGVVVVILALQSARFAGMIILLFAVFTDVLDGYVARRYNMSSKLGELVLEPVCDMTLSVAAVAGLVLTGVWPWWVAVVLLVFAGVLQLISQFADANDVMRRLKRHQYYIHPLLFIVTMLVACMWYIYLGTESRPTTRVVLYIAFLAAIAVTATSKRERLAQLFAGPQQAA